MMSESDLAQALHDALGQKEDGEGKPTKISSETQAYATGVMAALKAATVMNPPGTVTGTGAPGTPLSDGAATLGVFVGLTPAPMLAKTQVGEPGPMLAGENTAVITYLMTGLIEFSAGNIQGTCTATPTSPGILGPPASGTGGKVTGLTGAACMAMVAAGGVAGPDMLAHYTALIDYISDNLEVSYPAGSVQGAFGVGGGALIAGTALGGIVS